jgi:glycosyltransferase involved in cell wall biosynthesis
VDVPALDAAALAAPEPPVPDGCVVCIANMHHPVKGQTDLLMAMREVIRERPDARVAFVGDGVRRPHLERMASVLGIRERCHFLGFRRDGGAILARAVVAVSASYAEGISNAILEAMTLRLPVVATAVGGTPEIVREGVNGHLVPPGAPGALARRILDLLERPAARRRMGERGRKIVEREFSLAQMRLGYDALYEDLCAVKMPRVVYGAA